MKIRTHKITSSGTEIPVTIYIEKVDRDIVLKHQTLDRDERNNWCIHDKPCAKYNQRPCCPPKCKLFSELKERENMYLVAVKLTLEDYLQVSPKTKAQGQKSWFLFMSAAHKITRNIQNNISCYFEGQVFRVGGCLGCQYTKTKVCRRFAPALEGTGIDVVALTEDVFGIEIDWFKPKHPLQQMIAVGGIYTDENISKSKFKEVINDVCSNNL
jgi:predicted metal-binding protein